MITLTDIEGCSDLSALTGIIESRYDGDIERFLVDVDAGLNRLLRTDLKQAGRFVAAARSNLTSLPHKYQARISSMEARLALWSGNNRQALRRYTSTLQLYERFRNFEAAARIRKALVEVHMYLGQYPEAIKSGKQALRFFRRKKLTVDEAQTLTNMGNVYHRMDRNPDALSYYEKARRMFELTGGVALAIVDYNRANIYANLNQLGRAVELYRQSAEYYREAGLEIAENQAEYSIGYILFLEDRYTEALKKFERVYEAFTRLGDARSSAITELDIMEINIRLNQYGSAIMLGDGLVDQLRKLHLTYEQGKAHYFMATAKLELGDLSRAATELAKAEKLFIREKNDLWLGMIQNARNRVYQARGQYARAIHASQKATGLFDRSRDARRKIDAQIRMMEALFRSGTTRKAWELAEQLRQLQLAGYQLYDFHSALGDYLFEQGVFGKALGHFEAAVGVVEQMLSGLYQDEVRFFFAADKYRSYSRVVDCLLKLGRTDESFVRNLTALSLINKQVVSDTKLQAEVPRHILDSIEKLRATLNKSYQFPRDGQRQVVESTSYLSTEQRLWYQQRRARAYVYPKAVLRAEKERNPLGRLQSALSGRTVVNYHLSETQAGAFIASSTSTDFVPLAASVEEIRVLIRKLQFVMEKSIARQGCRADRVASVDHYLAQLYDRLMRPVVSRLNGGPVVIVVHGELAQVPFAALRAEDGSYLFDKYDLRLVVNPADVDRTKARRIKFGSSRNAVFGVSSETLPLVEREVTSIHSHFAHAHLYTEERAGCLQLMGELQKSGGFVHIAAHASRSSENPLFSRILLADGPFFPFDLFRAGIKAGLVTLSGCQTAAPGLYYGNSFSLARAFYQAGSRFVLASLWPVTDETALEFMREFYGRLRQSNDVAESYVCSMRHLREKATSPAHWGAFVLLGV